MSFFTNKNEIFFSLSLDPAGTKKAYVYRLEKSRFRIIMGLLPYVTLTSIIGLFGTIIVGIFFENRLSQDETTKYILIFNAMAAIVAIAELVQFLLIRKNCPIVSDSERSNIVNLTIFKTPSWQIYVSFLLALLTPLFGLIFLPDNSGGLISSINKSNDLEKFMYIQILLISTALSAVILSKVISILRHD
ncbi:hypothetical protein [Sphingomonas echinoides]|uniref:Uncharacterized protein n=1 Tax=Sphingomonas echinoides TaxID=59803 RepID=A0ABU4PQ20_9SPHN|nr:hypothetical protein [Sphingomonas echinoides]MDX5985223.1 hypothetical protein [Sphingomonas echinoides]